jgi:hypothetical protein
MSGFPLLQLVLRGVQDGFSHAQSCAVDGLRPEQEFQLLHVLAQVHQPDLHRGPHLALGAHQQTSLARVLIIEDMLDAVSDLGTPMIRRLFFLFSFRRVLPF